MVAPEGCSLSPSGLAAQRARATLVREAVTSVEQSPQRLRVTFTPELNRDAMAKLIATERECCSFLAIEYDDGERALSVNVTDPRHHGALNALAVLFFTPA